MKSQQWHLASFAIYSSLIICFLFIRSTFADNPNSGGSHYRKASSSDGSSDSSSSQYKNVPQAGSSTSSSDTKWQRIWLMLPAVVIFSIAYFTCKILCCMQDVNKRYEQPITYQYNMRDADEFVMTDGQSTYPLVPVGQSGPYSTGPVPPSPYGISLGPPVPTYNIRHAPHADLLPPLPQRYISNTSNADVDFNPTAPPPSYESVVK